MNITVNCDTLSYVLSETEYLNEISDCLTKVIENELLKGDESDTDLIDECVDLLDSLQNPGNDEAYIKLDSYRSILHYCHKNTSGSRIKFKRAAAAVIIMLLTGTAAITAKPALALQISGFFENFISDLFVMSDNTETVNSSISSIYLTVKERNNKIKSESDVDLSKLSVTAVYNDRTQHDIPIEECAVDKRIETLNGNKVLIVTVAYSGCASSIAFEMED